MGSVRKTDNNLQSRRFFSIMKRKARAVASVVCVLAALSLVLPAWAHLIPAAGNQTGACSETLLAFALPCDIACFPGTPLQPEFSTLVSTCCPPEQCNGPMPFPLTADCCCANVPSSECEPRLVPALRTLPVRYLSLFTFVQIPRTTFQARNLPHPLLPEWDSPPDIPLLSIATIVLVI